MDYASPFFILSNVSDIHYIRENPVTNGLVFNDWDYVYSSAKDYQTGKTGLVNIEFAI